MTDLREAAQMALDALDEACEIVGKAWAWRDEKGRPAAETLRVALAQPEPEPISYSGNGTAGRETNAKPTGFFFQMPKPPEPEHRDVVIAGDLWRVEFLPDNDANVRLVKANYTTKQEKQEPVAWVECDGQLVWNNREAAIGRNLYTAPPQRKWQGLTDEDLSVCDNDGVILARYWEAKLKEKNNG